MNKTRRVRRASPFLVASRRGFKIGVSIPVGGTRFSISKWLRR